LFRNSRNNITTTQLKKEEYTNTNKINIKIKYSKIKNNVHFRHCVPNPLLNFEFLSCYCLCSLALYNYFTSTCLKRCTKLHSIKRWMTNMSVKWVMTEISTWTRIHPCITVVSIKFFFANIFWSLKLTLCNLFKIIWFIDCKFFTFL